MRVALGDRQAGPERRAEHGGRVLADTAAPLQLRALADHGVALHEAVLVVHLAELGVERELAAGRDQHAIEARRAGLDVGDPVGGRAGEAAAALADQLGDPQARQRLGGHLRGQLLHRQGDLAPGPAQGRRDRRYRLGLLEPPAGLARLGDPELAAAKATRGSALPVSTSCASFSTALASRSGSTSTVIVPRSALIASSSASLLGCHVQLCSARRSMSGPASSARASSIAWAMPASVIAGAACACAAPPLRLQRLKRAHDIDRGRIGQRLAAGAGGGRQHLALGEAQRRVARRLLQLGSDTGEVGLEPAGIDAHARRDIQPALPDRPQLASPLDRPAAMAGRQRLLGRLVEVEAQADLLGRGRPAAILECDRDRRAQECGVALLDQRADLGAAHAGDRAALQADAIQRAIARE